MKIVAKTPKEYIEKIEESRKPAIRTLHELIIKTVPSLKPNLKANMYGMLGYGKFHYKSASGREGDWFKVGLASQKNYISLYICATKDGKYLAEWYRDQLPKANIGKSCIRFKKLEDIDLAVIKKILRETEKADWQV